MGQRQHMPNIKFRPVWMEQRLDDLSNDDLGAYIVWMNYNMGMMPKDERERAKYVNRALMSEQRRRRKK